MDINSISSTYGKSFDTHKTSSKSVQSKKKNELKGEKVEISDQSSQMQNLKDIVAKTDDIRLTVVKVIKARIKNNDYPIENNLDEMVKKMIQNNILKS
jgi:anti-sigma28 factor (negative regulator of flagellin synthesis)